MFAIIIAAIAIKEALAFLVLKHNRDRPSVYRNMLCLTKYCFSWFEILLLKRLTQPPLLIPESVRTVGSEESEMTIKTPFSWRNKL